MRTLGQPNPAWAGDHGDPDPAVRRALAAQNQEHGYLRAIVALGGARLLLPVVASGDDSMAGPDPDRHAELAAVTIEGPGGQRGLLAFTGLDAMRAWEPSARPVPCTVDELAATAVDAGASVLVVDLAGPHSLVVGDDVVAQLGKGRRLVELPADEGVAQFGWMFRATDFPDSTH